MERSIKTATTVLLSFLMAACAQLNPTQDPINGLQPTSSITSSTATSTQGMPTGTITSSEPTTKESIEYFNPLNESYYDGIKVITQYYTYLGHGLHEEAYGLLSAAARRSRSQEEYVKVTRMFFKTVEINSIIPYCVSVAKQGGQCPPDPADTIRFTVRIRVWGEGKMSGSVMSGDPQLIFIALVWEDETWKIDDFNTSPFTRDCPPELSELIYVVRPGFYENTDIGVELGSVSEAIEVLQQALTMHQPQWGEYTYQDAEGDERGLGYYFWNHAAGQTIIVNPRVWMVAAGLQLDWLIPQEYDLRPLIAETGVTLTHHYREFEFNEDVQNAYPYVTDPANYALYALFDYDSVKLIEWCETYVAMFNEPPR